MAEERAQLKVAQAKADEEARIRSEEVAQLKRAQQEALEETRITAEESGQLRVAQVEAALEVARIKAEVSAQFRVAQVEADELTDKCAVSSTEVDRRGAISHDLSLQVCFNGLTSLIVSNMV